MKSTELIEKLEELIEHLKKAFQFQSWGGIEEFHHRTQQLESEINALKAEQSDEEYLNECIKKATPGLSKIKDVDKELNEIRGIEQTISYTKEHLCSMLLSALQGLKVVYAPEEPEGRLMTELRRYLKC